MCDVAKSPARAVPDLGPPDSQAPHAWDTSGVARRFTMGDGLTYGWHRRGVPIPHVALVAVVLFAFGRITSTGGPASAAPSRLPTPTLTAHHVADDAALLNTLATDGVCTMQAAAAQQRARVRPPRTDEQLRNSFKFNAYLIKLASACRMYGVAMPAEGLKYRAHNALWDAEVAGRLYFAMRGIAYAALQTPNW